ncbi:MAG TPA: TorF family putative porin [Chlorobaculum sp.]|nr:TorF family putative porin [Chlorobaculum sp.]
MKRTAKLLTLAVALFAGFGSSNALAADGSFKIGADVVSSYVWRGGELGDSPAIQPAITYTFKNGIAIGAWGSYAIEKSTPGTSGDYRYKEVDLSLTVPVGPFSLGVVDYYVPSPGITRAFDYSKDGPNVIEINAGYAEGNLSLLAAINVAGFKGDAAAGTDGIKNAKYFEAGYKFYNKDGYSAKAVVGVGDEDYYGDQYLIGKNNRLAVVNTGISVSKDRFTGSFVYNPDTEASSLVFMASF